MKLVSIKTALKWLSLSLPFIITACGGGGGGASGGSSSSASSSSNSSSSAASQYSMADFSGDLGRAITVEYQQLNTDVAALESAASTFCADTASTVAFEQLQTGWVVAQRQWQRVQGINFGPANDDNRRYLIAFYPIDDASLSSRVEALISGTQNIAETIPASAAELQGFPALEYLLFRENALTLIRVPAETARHCEFISVVAGNLDSLIEPIANEWAGSYGAAFSASDNSQASLENWFGGIAELLQIVEDSKLRQVATGNTDNIESALAQVSRDNIAQNLDSLFSITTMGIDSGLDYLLIESDLASLNTEFAMRLAQFVTAESASDLSLLALSETSAGVTEMEILADTVHQVLEFFASDIADALGIYIGFNGADGD
ncbi:imelysin family protein [Teredinibacter haidensis]|uniref:imelysin family protein n=1 Tax=Teredinibacter haidensis TaxID=2731755 RepID=UPI000948A471|nr:imelysin family protein [Teredinibacter haidensis]